MARRDGMDTQEPSSRLWRVGSEPHGEHDNYGVQSAPRWGLVAVLAVVALVVLAWVVVAHL